MLIHLRALFYLLERSLLSSIFRMFSIIIVRSRDFFPIPELLNRCINYDMNHISLTNILNVLYSIDYWLSIPSTYGDHHLLDLI